MKELKYIRRCFAVATGVSLLVLFWAIFAVPFRHYFQADQIFTAVPEIGKMGLSPRVTAALEAGSTNRMILVGAMGAVLVVAGGLGTRIVKKMEAAEHAVAGYASQARQP